MLDRLFDFLRPRPFSFNVFSPALSESGIVMPASSPARAVLPSGKIANTTSTEARLTSLVHIPPGFA
jgi:hypothetical protein